MRRKINTHFALITVVAILLTVALSIVVYYDLFQKEIVSSLKTYTHVMKASDIFEQTEFDSEDFVVDDLRVTLVNADGTVAFDNSADVESMDNHALRPEILEAFDGGEGDAVRHSDTLEKNTFYYAVKLDDGRVLRVAKEAASMWSFLLPMIPLIFWMSVLLLAACMALAYFLTKSLVAPIEKMALHMDEEEYTTEYKEMQPFLDTIQKQHQDLIESTQIRQEFTANVSHELKTPLTAISGYSELIESGITGKEDTTRFAREIHKSSNRLLTLINDIIRLSELDSGCDMFVTENLDLYELAEKCVDMLQLSAEKHEVTLMISGESCFVTANREMIEEIMYNLCSNAIRYNVPNGRVMVSIGREGGQAVISVEDTGIGIPAEDQKRIFERFYRVDKSRSKSTGGTGLGLAIVKHAVAQHNAEIHLWSKCGEGTRIRVVFPEETGRTSEEKCGAERG